MNKKQRQLGLKIFAILTIIGLIIGSLGSALLSF